MYKPFGIYKLKLKTRREQLQQEILNYIQIVFHKQRIVQGKNFQDKFATHLVIYVKFEQTHLILFCDALHNAKIYQLQLIKNNFKQQTT